MPTHPIWIFHAKGATSMPTRIARISRRMSRRLGVHGMGLLLIAVAWATIGITIITTPDPEAYPGVFYLGIDPSIRATLWLVPSILCLISALDRRGPRRDGIALTLAFAPPMLRASSYFWSWVIDVWPGPQTGHPRGGSLTIIYVCLIGLVVLVAAIPDDGDGCERE